MAPVVDERTRVGKASGAGSHEAVTLDESERTRCEVWTRVMGYHRPVSSFNVGKRGEYEERRCFVEPDDLA